VAKFIPTLGSISGKVGGLVFSHNAAGAYIRSKGLVINPQTEKQTYQRGLVSEYATQWEALDPAARLAWEAFASSNPITTPNGGTRIISGLSWWVRLNKIHTNLYDIADTPPGTIPTSYPPVSNMEFLSQPEKVTWETTPPTMTAICAYIGSQYYWALWYATPPQGRNAGFAKGWRLIGATKLQDVVGSVDVLQMYVATFGVLLPQTTVFLGCRMVYFNPTAPPPNFYYWGCGPLGIERGYVSL